MWKAVKRKCCPKCGGTIIVSYLYQTSHDYRITKRGKLSKRFTRQGEGSMEVAIAGCNNCDAYWDADSFCIEDDCFYEWQYTDEEVADGK